MRVNSPSTKTQPVRISRLRVGLGTFISIDLQGGTEQHALTLIDAAAAAIARVELRMHPNRPGSDLANLRAAPVGQPIRVDVWTVQILALCKRLQHASAGVFDPCLPEAPGCLDDVELPAPDRIVAHATVSIDLGGIAKGFAVDAAVEALMAAGCDGARVNAGGDLRVFGAHTYSFVCLDPSGSNVRLELCNASLASSRIDARDRPTEHRGYYNRVRRPRAGAAAADMPPAVAIAAPSAALADALTKCSLLCTPLQMSEVLREFKATRIL